MGDPKIGSFIMENPFKWMIWGYPCFRKPPYVVDIFKELMLANVKIVYMIVFIRSMSYTRKWVRGRRILVAFPKGPKETLICC